ncbi:MAG: apolipoprotein N-acyltransferase [Candidatus Binatia bacterium]
MILHFAATAIAAVLFALVYEPFHAGAVSFLALTPIVLVFTSPSVPCSPLKALFFGFSFGLCAAMAIVGPWMYSAAADYFEQGMAWSLAFTLAVNAVYVALFQAGAFLALRLLSGAPPLARVFGAASMWTVFEMLRAADPAGNRWALLGQGASSLPLIREAATFGGEIFVGWMAALCGAAIGVGLQRDLNSRNAVRCMVIGVAVPLSLAFLGGVERLRDPDIGPLPPLRVAVVQAEIASRDVWDPAQRVAHWNAYVEATAALPAKSIDLVVWPESAVPFLLDSDPSAKARLHELANSLGAAILLGAPRSAGTGEGRAAVFNSAYFFAPGSDEVKTYDKRRLLPFVERSAGENEGEGADYQAGTSVALFDVKGWRIAPLLCFEALYPEYAREAVLGGAHLLVNLSNDAWFSGGAGPEQHASMSRMRAIELRRPMVRAANGGISGAIAPDGEDISFPIRRAKAVGIYEIPSPPRRLTLAATHPGVVPVAASAIAALVLLLSLRALFVPKD